MSREIVFFFAKNKKETTYYMLNSNSWNAIINFDDVVLHTLFVRAYSRSIMCKKTHVFLNKNTLKHGDGKKRHGEKSRRKKTQRKKNRREKNRRKKISENNHKNGVCKNCCSVNLYIRKKKSSQPNRMKFRKSSIINRN